MPILRSFATACCSFLCTTSRSISSLDVCMFPWASIKRSCCDDSKSLFWSCSGLLSPGLVTLSGNKFCYSILIDLSMMMRWTYFSRYVFKNWVSASIFAFISSWHFFQRASALGGSFVSFKNRLPRIFLDNRCRLTQIIDFTCLRWFYYSKFITFHSSRLI